MLLKYQEIACTCIRLQLRTSIYQFRASLLEIAFVTISLTYGDEHSKHF